MPSKSNPGNISVRGGRATTNSVGREALDFDILHLLQDLGGGSTPGGVNGQIQYNDAGAFGGTSITFDSTSGSLTVPVGVSSHVSVVPLSSYTVDSSTPQDFAVMVDTVTIGAPSTIQLPTIQVGRIIIIKDASGDAAANNIVINPSAGQQIEGGPSLTIIANWGSVILQGTQIPGAPTADVWQVLSIR